MWLCLLLMVFVSALASAASAATVPLLDVKGAIGPAISDYIHRGLNKAEKSGAPFVILRIDTPGGLVSSMREINKDILASKIPVVGYVAPSGARAASAGTYMLYACHVAAMAPGTNLGAATPITIGGGLPFSSPKGDDKKDEKQMTPATQSQRKPELADKALSDSIAYIKSLAQLRKRNVEWAEKAVREAASATADEALKLNVIDFIAPDLRSLLDQLNGRVVEIDGRNISLDTAGVQVVVMEPDWRSNFLGIITDPNIAYILMLIGIYGLILEFFHPGVFLPGIVGAICLVTALYAFQVLPVNYAGAALILLGIGLMVAEIFAPSFGALGVGGAVAFILGSIMLIDTDVPQFQVSWRLIAPIALAATGSMLLVVTMVARSRQRPVVSGPEQMVGDVGKVVDWQENIGLIRVHGELWSATSNAALSAGQSVEITGIDGLILTVSPIE